MDRVLGSEFLATTKYMGPVRDKPSSTVMWYFPKLFQSLASRWDVAFDRYTAATDLRAPPRVLSRAPTTVRSWTVSAKAGLSLAQLMEAFDGRVVAAATEARARLWALARGVAKTRSSPSSPPPSARPSQANCSCDSAAELLHNVDR